MPIGEILLAALAKSAADKASDAVFDIPRQKGLSKLSIDTSQARSCLMEQVKVLEKWSSSISLSGLLRDKRLIDSFVELSLDIGLSRFQRDKEVGGSVTLDEIYAEPGHISILGRPGAGKTTSLQKLAQSALHNWEVGTGGTPVLVRLRDLKPGESLSAHLLSLLGILVRLPMGQEPEVQLMSQFRVANSYLDSVSAVLLVDGLDETNIESRALVETELRNIALSGGAHRLLLTCRTADFHIHLQNVQTYTIRSLEADQIEDFATRWLGAHEARQFLRAVKQNPYAGAEVVPLTLAHLCALYERNGELPQRPIEIYEQIVSLLVEEWDKQRGIHRMSHYAEFSARKKERFLQALAYGLAMSGKKGTFSDFDLQHQYGDIAPSFNLPMEEAGAVAEEVESHTGLIQLVGSRRYDFVHLVIQEFLTAMHAHRQVNPVKKLVPHFPNELALVVAYSSDPEEYLEEILLEATDRAGKEFITAFLSRLAIEQASWRPTARLGWTFAACLDLLTRLLLVSSNRTSLRFPTEVAVLLQQETVSSAIFLMKKEVRVYEEDRVFRLVAMPHSTMSPLLREKLLKRADPTLVLPRSEKKIQRLLRTRRKSAAGDRPTLRFSDAYRETRTDGDE